MSLWNLLFESFPGPGDSFLIKSKVLCLGKNYGQEKDEVKF